MSDPFSEALAESRLRTLELEELVSTIRTRTLLARLDRLPHPGRPRDSDDDPPPVLKPTLSPAEVAAGWRAGGQAWMAALGRRDLSAVVAATRDPYIGPGFASDDHFCRALTTILRPRQLERAVSNLVLQRHPPSPTLCTALHHLRAADPERAPEWWSQVLNQQLAGRLAAAITRDGWVRVREDLHLPELVSSSTWADAVVGTATSTRVDELERLLAFVDGGEAKSPVAPLRSAHLQIVRKLVSVGLKDSTIRLRIATLLRGRIGDVFGVADAERWRELAKERLQVRAWVANQILDVLFKHLVPDLEGSHQTESRRQFWKKYTHRIERMWLIVESKLRRRLERGEVQELLAQVGDVIEVKDLSGAPEQAIVWMQLSADGGNTVTVIEGNANSSCRLRPGAHKVPAFKVVDYSNHIVHGTFDEAHSNVVRQGHHHGWESHLAWKLGNFGIRP